MEVRCLSGLKWKTVTDNEALRQSLESVMRGSGFTLVSKTIPKLISRNEEKWNEVGMG